MKRAIVFLHERRAECPNAELLLAVHDELVVEVPEAEAERAKRWVSACMVDAISPWLGPIPVAVESTIGRTWAGADTPNVSTPERKAA